MSDETASPAPGAPIVDRVTAVGLLFEAASGLRRSLAPRLEADLGVAGQSFEILIRLHRSPRAELRMSDLAAQTGLTPSGLTRAVDRLERAGLVRREACPSDRRGAFARLTESGSARTATALANHREELDEFFERLLCKKDEAELARLLRLVRDRVYPTAAQLSTEDRCAGPRLDMEHGRPAR